MQSSCTFTTSALAVACGERAWVRAGLQLVRERVLDVPWMVPDDEYSGFRERRLSSSQRCQS